jgi:hypothetical protein
MTSQVPKPTSIMVRDDTPSTRTQSDAIIETHHLSLLPEELIENICAYLPKTDMGNFRLTARILKEKSNHAFSVCHFKVTQIMLTLESLETLINKIANDPRYGASVKELQICLVTFPLQAKSQLTGQPLTEKEIKAFEMSSSVERDTDTEDASPAAGGSEQKFLDTLKRTRRKLYSRHHHSQNLLRTQSIDVTLLAEALRCLPALESISILGNLDPMNPPWGARNVQSDIGIWPPSVFCMTATKTQLSPGYGRPWGETDVVRYCKRFSTHTMAVVFGALSRSDIKLKRALRLEGAPYSFPIPSKSDSRRLFPTATPSRTFSSDRIQDLLPAFSDLKELSLKAYHYQRFIGDNFSLTDLTPFTWTSKFTPLWQSIRILSIAGAGHAHEASIFGDSTSPHPATKPSNKLGAAIFPHLRVLKITDTLFRIENIIQMLQNHSSTLEALCIHNCTPVSRLDYVDLLRSLTSLPVLLSLDLHRGSPTSGYHKYMNRWTLEGMQSVTEIKIKKKTAAAFQNALEVKIAAVLATNKTPWGSK